MSENNTNSKYFSLFLKNEILTKSKRLKSKFIPISEVIDGKLKTLSIKSIQDLTGTLKYFFVFIVKNHSKKPKKRYFLMIQIATQSSDLLVNLAKDPAIEHGIRLIQYALYPESLRISLLGMKELKKADDYQKSIEILKAFRQAFRKKLDKIKDLA